MDDYDHETLDTMGKTSHTCVPIEKERYVDLINAMRNEFSSDVFGKPKDDSFDSSIHQIYQSFDGKELYPTIEEKAAMLLYLIVKNHSYIDGNKRIAAITLFIAVSKPDEMETVKKVLVSILNR